MASGFRLISAHSVVVLAEKLAERLERRADPFVPETVLVTSFAQRVWLRRFLAEKLGICANIDFKSPEEFLEEIEPAESKKFFASDTLTWRIFSVLKKIAATRPKPPDELIFGLSKKNEPEFFARAAELSALFWRYQSFRPAMICDWTRDAPEPPGTDADFLHEYRRQKNLWQKLELDGIPAPAEAWINFLKNGTAAENVPDKIFAFAPSALPRVHVELLEKLSETSEVFLFHHNLAAGLWTESRTEKSRLRERLRQRKNADESDDDFFGNELLSAWGKAAKPIAEHLIDRGFLDETTALDRPPEADSLLHALQRDIRTDARTPQKFSPAPNDRSLHISNAPNKLREVEILRDELLARFAKTPELKPSDVFVELTDIAAYTPFIRTAFENSGIPFSIADSPDDEIFPAAAAFLEMLRVAQGEFRLSEILALIGNETVRHALGLDDDEAAALRETLAESGARWGIDATFRSARIFGETAPAEEFRDAAKTLADNNSWDFGLRRLALGYLCGSAEETPFPSAGASAPSSVPGLTEDAPSPIGKIFRLIKTLAETNRVAAENPSLPVPEWCRFLREKFTDTLLETGDGSAEILRRTLGKISDAAEKGAPGGAVPACSFATFFRALQRQKLSVRRGANGMLRGKLTFCEMRPLRNIPAKIICIAGLDDGAFPNAGNASVLDLTRFRPKNFSPETVHWDRTPRDDACLLFLESILAAQDALLLSYVGRDATDGRAVPPCVPLAKLRDYVGKMMPDGNASAFETQHRLHGFSPKYFSSDEKISREYFSFSREDFETAKTLERAETTVGDAPSRERFRVPKFPVKISLAQLAAFFKSPADFLRQECFGIAKAPENNRPSDDDPADAPDAFSATRIHNAIFKKILDTKLADANADEKFSQNEEIRTARSREISAGRTSALAEPGKFENELAKNLTDFPAAEEKIPWGLTRVGSDEIPREIAFPASGDQPEITVAPFFENLFRAPDGRLILALFGKKKFDWRALVETLVNAAALANAFPQENFSAFYFLPSEKTAREISNVSLAASGLTLRSLVGIYAKRISTPPLFFEKMPTEEKFLSDREKFTDAVRAAWEKPDRRSDVSERFIFGDDAPSRLANDISEFVFTFVRAATSAFIEPPKDDSAKPKSRAKKSK